MIGSGSLANPGLMACLAWFGTLCWIICFTWMWRISRKQNELLQELHDQTDRIEHLSKVEHDLIKEVHPQVGEITEQIREVAETVKRNGD